MAKRETFVEKYGREPRDFTDPFPTDCKCGQTGHPPRCPKCEPL